MPGLSLGVNARIGGSANGATLPPPPSSTAAAFGPAYTGAPPSRTAALAPNDPFGVAFWTGIAALGLLLLIRHSLPA